MQLYLIRHPKPEIVSGICYGRSDILSSEVECELVLPALRAALPADIPVYSSPLQRCALLANHLHPAPVFDPRLMEMDFGDWELKSWDQIPRAEIDAWAADVSNYRPGGAENVIEMATRVIHFLQDVKNIMMNAGQQHLAVVCHAGTMRLMLAYQPAIDPIALAKRVESYPQTIGFGECKQLQLGECED